MTLSTDITEADRPLHRNVSKQADVAFLRELRHADRERYNRLTAAIERGVYKAARQKQEVQTIELPKAA
jgi:hypothetical protein